MESYKKDRFKFPKSIALEWFKILSEIEKQGMNIEEMKSEIAGTYIFNRIDILFRAYSCGGILREPRFPAFSQIQQNLLEFLRNYSE